MNKISKPKRGRALSQSGIDALPKKVGAALKTGPTHMPTPFLGLDPFPRLSISSSTMLAWISSSSASLRTVTKGSNGWQVIVETRLSHLKLIVQCVGKTQLPAQQASHVYVVHSKTP